MKLALVVLLALGMTMAWQASVVADNNARQELSPQITDGMATLPAQDRQQRG